MHSLWRRITRSVAQVQSVFDIAVGDFGTDVEIAVRVIAAVHLGPFQAGGGGGQGAADGGSGCAVHKSVEVAGASDKSIGIGLGCKTSL